MKLSDLTPNEKNPRTITDAKLKQLAKAIKEFGSLDGFIWNSKTKRLVSGHQRQKIGTDSQITITKKFSKPTRTGTTAVGFVTIDGEQFPYRQVYWDEHTEKAANIAANKGAGEWDTALLTDWMKELNSFDLEFDMDLTMFDADEIKDMTGVEVEGYTRTGPTGVDEDEVSEKAPARTKLGDGYILGEHRLLCGDSTDIAQVERLMKGEKADMVFTDPPYGISIVKNNKVGSPAKRGFVGLDEKARAVEYRAVEYRAVEGDDKPFDPAFILSLDVPTVVLWGANHYASKLPDKPQWLIWDKKLESGKLDNNNFSDCELAWTNNIALSAKIYRHPWAGMLRKGDRKEELSARVHPTQKPVGMCTEVIQDFSKINDSVIDLFGGSGSTLIACQKTGRKCRMMEIDPHYCDVIVERWEKYTGLKAKLIRTETKLRKTNKSLVNRHAQVD